MNSEYLKETAAIAALKFIEPQLESTTIIGVGTGSTASFFIAALSEIKQKFNAAVSSSEASTEQLKKLDINVVDLSVGRKVQFYIDGADEVAPDNSLIKGGGAALTREKIVATSAEQFICIVDDSKLVNKLGKFPLPVEVIPMARGLVAEHLVKLGGLPEFREGTLTDNGNTILDVYDLDLSSPDRMEEEINNIVGVVCNGLFAATRPDKVIIGGKSGLTIR